MNESESRKYRASTITSLGEGVFDVLVIGGGIVGAGVAREGAMRGLRVGLIEQQDFAQGTSSRSSRLLHGGLRYLAQGRVLLVHEASREKRILRLIAPHLAEPLAFIFPTYRRGAWPKWKLRIGVRLYDLLCGKNLGRSQVLRPRQVLDLLPGLFSDRLTGAVRYYDAKTNDSRLVLDTLRSAAGIGGRVLNYARLEQAEPSSGGWACRVRDVLSDHVFEVKASTVVNATGPWSDRLKQSRTRLRLTKGVHLVIDRQRLPMPDAVVMGKDRRILFAIPWYDRVILGTTDTDYEGPLDHPTCNAADVAYILDVVNSSFPHAKLGVDDILSAWAGVRPLIAGEGGPSDISRGHEITLQNNGWCDVAGGKLTTYRLMAEQTIDRIESQFHFSAGPSRSATLPLIDVNETTGVSAIAPSPVTQQAVVHYCEKEWAVTLDDVMTRRTSWRHYHSDQHELANKVADWMADPLGWTKKEKQQYLTDYLTSIESARRAWRGEEEQKQQENGP